MKLTKKQRNAAYKKALNNLSTRSCYGLCGLLYKDFGFKILDRFKNSSELQLFIKPGSTIKYPFGDDSGRWNCYGERELDPIRRIILDFAIAMTE